MSFLSRALRRKDKPKQEDEYIELISRDKNTGEEKIVGYARKTK